MAGVLQNQSTPKPEGAAPCAHSLWCRPCVLTTLLGAWGIGASVAVGRGSCGAGTDWGTFVPWSRGLGGQGGICQPQAPQLVSLQQGRWRQTAQRCPCPPWLPTPVLPVPWQGQGVLPCLAAPLLAPFLGGKAARPVPAGCWGAGFGLFPCRKWWHCPEWLGCHRVLSQ